jgi:hypothetical protein
MHQDSIRSVSSAAAVGIGIGIRKQLFQSRLHQLRWVQKYPARRAIPAVYFLMKRHMSKGPRILVCVPTSHDISYIIAELYPKTLTFSFFLFFTKVLENVGNKIARGTYRTTSAFHPSNLYDN